MRTEEELKACVGKEERLMRLLLPLERIGQQSIWNSKGEEQKEESAQTIAQKGRRNKYETKIRIRWMGIG